MRFITVFVSVALATAGMLSLVRGVLYDAPCHATGGALGFAMQHGAVTAVCNYPTGVLAPAPVEVR